MEGYLKPMEKRAVDRNLLHHGSSILGFKGFSFGFTFLSSNYVFFWGWCTYRRMPFFFLGHLGIKACSCANGWDDLISIIYVFNSFRTRSFQ